MGEPEDLTGKRFGKLIVLNRNGRTGSKRKITWLCRCDCGKIHITLGESLRSGHCKSCGCSSYKDMKGKKFGKLKVLKKVENKSLSDRSAPWLCLCECGNKTIVRGNTLRSGRTKSCGCGLSEATTYIDAKGRVCTQCLKYKTLNNFSKSNRSVSGYRSTCKPCCHLQHVKYYEKNKYDIAKKSLKYNIKNKEKLNKSRLKAYHSSPKTKLSSCVARYMRRNLANGKKGVHWGDIVGYSVDELKKHLEGLFEDGMTWANYGSGEGKWHIDHKIPILVFNFKTYNDIDFRRCWSLSNLQPLWGKDNIKKSAKLDKPFQPCLRLAI